MNLEASLPDDVLAGILRRLAPRFLAVSRCVCKAWCRVVDTRRLLRADLLPLSLGGIFFNCQDLHSTQFLSRPTTGAAVSGRLDYTASKGTAPDIPEDWPLTYVQDQCNGLLLLYHCVVNPATQQWALLPPRPPRPQPHPSWGMESVLTEEFLVFDPILSPHWELLIVPHFPINLNECDGSEWPPSTLSLSIFSSKIGSWEERKFCRDKVITGMLPRRFGSIRFALHQCAYWREALYIICSDHFLMRISLSDNTYQLIRLLAEDGETIRNLDYLYLGKSGNGIYCASSFQESHLQVWFLNHQTEWVLKHSNDICPILPNLDKYDIHRRGPWILQEFNFCKSDLEYYCFEDFDFDDEDSAEEHNNEAVVHEKFEWDSDNDNVLEPGSSINNSFIDILGFHPFKEVVFLLSTRFDRMLAYNWSTSKLQDLGKVFPKFYTDRGRYGFYHHAIVTKSFPYTPCWLGELPEKLNLEAQVED